MVFIRKTIESFIKRPWLLGVVLTAIVILIFAIKGITSDTTKDNPINVSDNSPTKKDESDANEKDVIAPDDNYTIPGDNSSNEKKTSEKNPNAIAPDDPYDTDPELKAAMKEKINGAPAFQALPYFSKGVSIDFTDVLPDDRIVISISYSGSKYQAKEVWKKFLSMNKDKGTAYIVVYEK